MHSNTKKRRRDVKKRSSFPAKKNTVKFLEDDKSFGSNASSCLKVFLFALALLSLILIVAYLKSPISAIVVKDIPNIEFNGPFALNRKLTNGKRISMPAPESVVEDEFGNLYAGLHDGRIVKIYRSDDGVIGEGRIENITDGCKLDDYATSDALPRHRPLGIRLVNNTLFVADAFYGIFTIKLSNKKMETLVKLNDVSPSMRFPDDLDITADGSFIYFTDASAKYSYNVAAYEVLEGSCTGRLFKYNLITKQLNTIVKDLCFANGVQLTKDEKMVMITEYSRPRVVWIDTSTWQTKRVLMLPALADNIRRNVRGNNWIATSGTFNSVSKFLHNFPILRQILIGLVPKNMLRKFVSFDRNVLIEVDDDGNIIDVMHDPDGTLALGLSQATDLSDGRIALGSHFAPFLAIAENIRSN